MIATVVDWAALAQVAYTALLVSVAVTTLFTGGLLLSQAGPAGGSSAGRRVLGGACLLASLALVLAGLYVVFTAK